MKANQPKEQKKPIVLEPCCVCGKKVESFYGRWGNTGTCSKACELIHVKKISFFFGGEA